MHWDIPGLRSLWFSTPEIKVSSPAMGVSDSSFIQTLLVKSLCSSQNFFSSFFGGPQGIWDDEIPLG